MKVVQNEYQFFKITNVYGLILSQNKNYLKINQGTWQIYIVKVVQYEYELLKICVCLKWHSNQPTEEYSLILRKNLRILKIYQGHEVNTCLN